MKCCVALSNCCVACDFRGFSAELQKFRFLKIFVHTFSTWPTFYISYSVPLPSPRSRLPFWPLLHLPFSRRRRVLSSSDHSAYPRIRIQATADNQQPFASGQVRTSLLGPSRRLQQEAIHVSGGSNCKRWAGDKQQVG